MAGTKCFLINFIKYFHKKLITKDIKVFFQRLTMDVSKPILIIDGSYYIFYRYYAIYNWASKAGILTDENPMNNTDFVTKYEKMFTSCVKNLAKGYEVPWDNVVFAKDCPREMIWRMKHFPEYKSTRDETRLSNFDKTVFVKSYSEIIPNLGCKVLEHPGLEADDICALLTKWIISQNNEADITIVTNDNDYIQLCTLSDKIVIVNLAGRQIKERAPIDVKKYLLYKCIIGDKADNIPGIYPKCGPKTAERLATNDEELTKLFLKNQEAKTQFELNRLIIDFNYIPDDITKEVHTKFEKI